MKRFYILCAFVLIASAGLTVVAQSQEKPFVPVTDEMLWKPDPANWLMWRRTLDSWGYSPLNEVNRNNVSRLKMTWTRGIGTGRTQEATPLVYNGTMYIPNPGDVIMAMDAKTGDLKWEYKRKYPEGVNGGTNRNMAIWGTTLIDAGADNSIYAVDARTGNLAWETQVLKAGVRANASSGPIIANGKVITGRQCQPDATSDSCIITAHDAQTGKEVWRTRTIPRPGEPGSETWGDVPLEQRWHVGTWMVPSYDPETNMIYVGTSVTIPAPKFTLGGNDKQHLYHNSTLALDADTGKIVWYYQHIVDHWDLDHPFERLLVETAITPDAKEVAWINPKIKPGERRKVITGIPGKTGIVYTLDRRTGEFLWARPTVMQNVVQHDRRRNRQGHGESRSDLHREGTDEAGVPGQQRRQELAGRRVQPDDQHDVLPAAEHVHERDDDGRHARSVEGLRPRDAGRARAGHAERRQRVGDFGRDRQDGVEARAARGCALARRDRRRTGLRRRRERTLPRVRRSQRQGAVGSESGFAGQRLPGDVCRRRQTVRRGHNGAVARRGIR